MSATRSVKDHRWAFVKDAGQCRRGRACDASVLVRDIESLRDRHVTAKDWSAPLPPLGLVCWDCRFCFHCAEEPCQSRRRAGYPEDTETTTASPRSGEAVA